MDVTKLEDNLEVVAALPGTLGAQALLLASIGVDGVVSYGVSWRIREIGIRMTLGADGREVMSLLLRQAMRPVVIGAVVGVAACAGVSQVRSKVLYGIGSHDPIHKGALDFAGRRPQGELYSRDARDEGRSGRSYATNDTRPPRSAKSATKCVPLALPLS